MVLLLTGADLEQLLEVGEVIDTVEHAFAAHARGQAVTPLRTALQPPGTRGVVLTMPCALAEPAAVGVKVVSVYPDNPSRGLPRLTSLYLLADYDTGAPLAVMDGGYLTAIRTAAGSAVATRYLARADARTLGTFGTGVQARFHLQALRRVRAIERVLVSATSETNARAFAQWVRDTCGIDASPASAEEASSADVLAVCTTSPTPVVLADSTRPGAHVNAVGAFTPTTRELPTALIERARVYVDSRAGAFSEGGDLLIPVQEGRFSFDRVVGEVGEVVLGTVPARVDARDVTVYKSVGAAFLDAATARLAFDRATSAGLGHAFAFTDS